MKLYTGYWSKTCQNGPTMSNRNFLVKIDRKNIYVICDFFRHVHKFPSWSIKIIGNIKNVIQESSSSHYKIAFMNAYTFPCTENSLALVPFDC